MDDPVGVPRHVASLRAGRGPRRYDEERGCYVYDVSFTASPPLTGRVRGVAEAFGVALDDRRQVLYRDFELRLGEGDVVYVTDDSGSGKSVLLRALTEHLLRMKADDPRFFDRVCGRRDLLHTVIRLRNGSTLLAQPPVPETIRGHTAKAVYLMEANFIREDEDLYTAILFALNTTNGYLIAESTPWNRDSVFYRMLHDDAFKGFSRYSVPYTEALPPDGPLQPEMVRMIEEQLSGDSSRWRREMLCEWTEDVDRWLPTSLIALCQDSEAHYYMAEKRRGGASTLA